jgi:hypothetical protein
MPKTSYRKIKLTQGQYALVDTSDFEWLNSFTWWAQYDPSIDGYYVRTQIKRASKDWPMVTMHRLLLGLGFGDKRVGDHVNGNPLDNRRHNLRIATVRQNCCNVKLSTRNTSGYKGVTWRKSRDRWLAQIRVNGKLKILGHFKDKLLAHKAYCTASAKYHGEFGRIK